MNKKVIALIGAIIVILCIAIPFVISKNAKYEVKFNSNGGTIVETQSVKKGEVLQKPTDPTKEGYVFDNWYLNDTVYDFSSKVTKNITLDAKWIKVDKEDTDNSLTYTVTFNTNGGSKISSLKVNDGEKVTKPSNPTKDGYKFVEWLLDGKSYDFTKEVTGNITLVASWEKETTTNTNKTTSKTTTTSKNTTNNVNKTNTQTQTNTNTQTETKTETIRVSSVSISKSSLSLKVGETANLSVTINPSNATNKNATWTSSNKSVATVDGNGKVTAMGAGSATITVTVDGKSATATVTVNKDVSFSIETVKIDASSANEYMYYIKSSEGNRVSGRIEVTIIGGAKTEYDITTAGKKLSKSAISDVKVISVN